MIISEKDLAELTAELNRVNITTDSDKLGEFLAGDMIARITFIKMEVKDDEMLNHTLGLLFSSLLLTSCDTLEEYLGIIRKMQQAGEVLEKHANKL